MSNENIPCPALRRQTTDCANNCYNCGARSEYKHEEYICWNCNRFATPLAAAAARLAFLRKGTGFITPNLPNAWWLREFRTASVTWKRWTFPVYRWGPEERSLANIW